MVIIFLLILFLIIGIPIGMTFIMYKWISKSGFNKGWRVLAFVPVIFAGYFMYTGVYPSSDFYKEDFREVTNMEFPQSGVLTYKTASFPDHFGDYTSSFSIELKQSDLEKLEKHIRLNGFKEKQNIFHSKQQEYIEQKLRNKKYSKMFVVDSIVGKYYCVGFLDDRKSVILTRASW